MVSEGVSTVEIAFAIRQFSNIRDLYEHGQKIVTWLPQFEEQCSRIMESRPANAKEVRFIILHDIDSATAVYNAGNCPAWSDVKKGLVHLCPEPSEWRKLLQEETEFLQAEADNSVAIRLERFYRMWTMRYIATVFIGQGIAWQYQPFQIMEEFAELRWLYRGLALHVGRRLWNICEPYVPDETEQFEQLAAEGIETKEERTIASRTLQTAQSIQQPPLFLDLMAAAAAAELAERSGGVPQLCARITSVLPQCHQHADQWSLLQALGLLDVDAMAVLKRYAICD